MFVFLPTISFFCRVLIGNHCCSISAFVCRHNAKSMRTQKAHRTKSTAYTAVFRAICRANGGGGRLPNMDRIAKRLTMIDNEEHRIQTFARLVEAYERKSQVLFEVARQKLYNDAVVHIRRTSIDAEYTIDPEAPFIQWAVCPARWKVSLAKFKQFTMRQIAIRGHQTVEQYFRQRVWFKGQWHHTEDGYCVHEWHTFDWCVSHGHTPELLKLLANHPDAIRRVDRQRVLYELKQIKKQ